jgi:TusE/DsrC/DsvC family sulfur relay protein
MSILDALDLNEEGFLKNKDDWNKEIAMELAKLEGLSELSDDHWMIIDFCRSRAENSGAAPTLRQISKGAGVTTKQLFCLFPKGPAKKVAKIAGLGKPEGCV